MMKIAFTGPESSGKTTMARWVSKQFNLAYCPEFAREYLMGKPGYNRLDLDRITLGQLADWQEKGANFVADTEMTVMLIWSKYRYNAISEVIQEAYDAQQFDHYFLCAPDIPWEPDPLRENPNDRLNLFDLYETELIQSKRPFTVLSGSIEVRQKEVFDVVQSYFNT